MAGTSRPGQDQAQWAQHRVVDPDRGRRGSDPGEAGQGARAAGVVVRGVGKMCKHCEWLTEDKQAVHDFRVVGAKRLSEIHGREISPDDLEVVVTLTITETRGGYGLPQVYKLLDELSKETGAGF